MKIWNLMIVCVMFAGVMTGCGTSIAPLKNPIGSWNQPEVEAWVKDGLKLTEMSLTSAGNNNYSGTGKSADGTSYEIQVTQSTGKIECDHKERRPDGSTGAGKFSSAGAMPPGGIPVRN